MCSFLSGIFRFGHEARKLDQCSLYLYRKQLLIQFASEYIHNTLTQRRRSERQHRGIIMSQRKGYIGMYQCHAFKLLKYIAQLRLIGLEKLTARRNIEEQILNQETASGSAGYRLLLCYLRSSNRHTGAYFRLFLTGTQLYLCHSGNRCQSFSTEAHSGQGKKITGLTDFGSGMALKSQSGICLRHSFSVVNDLNGSLSGIYHHYINPLGFCIHGILNQFLDHRSRTLDHLARCNLIRNRIR